MKSKVNEKICDELPSFQKLSASLWQCLANSRNLLSSEWMNQGMNKGANELQMKVCFRPNLIYSTSCQPNEDCCLKGSHKKITTSEARATQKPFNAAPCKGKLFFFFPQNHLRQRHLCQDATKMPQSSGN